MTDFCFDRLGFGLLPCLTRPPSPPSYFFIFFTFTSSLFSLCCILVFTF
ncbi:hypothetical protein LINGRAHAP2_LOCUS6696, partial [Linum grandiflorum]